VGKPARIADLLRLMCGVGKNRQESQMAPGDRAAELLPVVQLGPVPFSRLALEVLGDDGIMI
jgi:hypothetical protein